jgi:TRAP-type C4-dicarboxylate transport system substrate-binding protein
MLLVSKAFWDGLSAPDKEAFRAGATAGVQAMRAFVDNVESTGIAQITAAGMKVGTLTPEERTAFQAALAPAYDVYAKQYGKDLIDQIIAAE